MTDNFQLVNLLKNKNKNVFNSINLNHVLYQYYSELHSYISFLKDNNIKLDKSQLNFSKLFIRHLLIDEGLKLELNRFYFDVTDFTIKDTLNNNSVELSEDYLKLQHQQLSLLLNSILIAPKPIKEKPVVNIVQKDVTEDVLDMSIKKESLINDLETIMNKKEIIEEKLVEPTAEINEKKRYQKLEKEKQQENIKKFDTNKEIYLQVKADLENKTLNKVPELFLKDYDIFEFFNKNNLIDSDYKYELYRSIHYYIKNDLDSIPEFIDDMEDDQQTRYLEMFDQYENDIFEICQEIKNKKYDSCIQSSLVNRLFSK